MMWFYKNSNAFSKFILSPQMLKFCALFYYYDYFFTEEASSKKLFIQTRKHFCGTVHIRKHIMIEHCP